MFTGLIQTVGTLKSITPRGNYRVLSIDARLGDEPLTMGESIACDGLCLTVTAFGNSRFEVDVSQESLARSIIGGYRAGAKINLERAIRAGERLGGHIVSGHIDGTGIVDKAGSVGDSLQLAVSFDRQFDSLVIEKGSLAINGVSLTINETGSGRASVNIIPHTADVTNLGLLKKGDRVNLEFDIIGKYIEKMVNKENKGNLTIDKLRESGW